jgi:ankyrin repeat protein
LCGADIEAQDMAGCTALFMAAKNKNKDLVLILLMNGSDPFTRSLVKKRVKDFATNKSI